MYCSFYRQLTIQKRRVNQFGLLRNQYHNNKDKSLLRARLPIETPAGNDINPIGDAKERGAGAKPD